MEENTSAPTVETSEDTFTKDQIREAVRLAKTLERSTTKANLGIAECLVRAVEHDVVEAANSVDDIKDFRAQSIGLFSTPISKATGRAITAKYLTEFVAIRHMRECLTEDVKPLVDRVGWESLRILARWAIHLPNDTLFEKHETYVESWRIQTGCEEKLEELVTLLAKRPKDRKTLRDIMDRHEASLRGDDGSASTDEFKEISRFLASIETKCKSLKMSKSTLAWWLLKTKTLNMADLISAAETIQRENVHGKPTAVPAVTATLDDSGKPNLNPLVNAATRIISNAA